MPTFKKAISFWNLNFWLLLISHIYHYGLPDLFPAPHPLPSGNSLQINNTAHFQLANALLQFVTVASTSEFLLTLRLVLHTWPFKLKNSPKPVTLHTILPSFIFLTILAFLWNNHTCTLAYLFILWLHLYSNGSCSLADITVSPVAGTLPNVLQTLNKYLLDKWTNLSSCLHCCSS